MNVILTPQPSFFPHNYEAARHSPSRATPPFNMSSRKRKADEEHDEMSVSPQSSPAVTSRQLSRPSKKVRASPDQIAGRPLSLPRLIETLDTTQLRTVLQKICDRHPDIGHEIVASAPRPSVSSTLKILEEYQDKFKAAMPYGQSSSDYTYYRVKQPLSALIDAISDFTAQYLPPIETQANISLQFLDGATKIIHELPDFDSTGYRHHKDGAYEEVAKAWALVISEASKRGGGFALHTGGWDQILTKHNHQSGGKLAAAMNALVQAGWTGNNNNNSHSSGHGSSDPNSILNQLMNGTYGSPVRVGPW